MKNNKFKSKVFISLLLLILGLYSTQAQTARDVIHINYSYFPRVGLKQNQGRVGARQFDIFGSLAPINLGKRVTFINAFYYRNTQLNYDETFQNQNAFPTGIHDIRYMSAFRVKMNPHWNLIMLSNVLLWSDLDRPISGKDFIAQSGFIMSYNHNTSDYNLKIGLGAGIGLFEFRHFRFWPLIQLAYQKSKVRCEIALPYANMTYKITKDFEAGIFSMVDNSISNVTPFTFENETASHLRIFQLIVAPTVSHRLYRNFFGHIKLGGLVPLRRLRPLDEDFNPIGLLNFGSTSSLFFKVGFSYRRPE